jgi:CspA family cold shock protein
MAYRDMWLTCEECGRQFVFRVEEQRRMERQGQEIEPPSLCPEHRGAEAPRRERLQEQQRAPRAGGQATPEPVVLGYGPHEGKVKWYSREKGYGFIVHPSGEEIFFHHTGIKAEDVEFADGTPVTFLVEETEKGPQAVEVEHLSK